MKYSVLPSFEASLRVLVPCFAFALAQGATPAAWAIAATTTTLSLKVDGKSVSTVEPHTVITLAAVVKAGSDTVKKGQVKFCVVESTYCEDSHLLGIRQLTSGGIAVLKFVPGSGNHHYKAAYIGTNNDGESESVAYPLTVVALSPSETSIGKSGSSGSYTLSASVTGRGSAASPTGPVYFLDKSNSNAELGKGMLGRGVTSSSFVKSFQELSKYPATIMVVDDFNNDGNKDLVLVNGPSDVNPGVNVLLGNGDGSFQKPKLIAQYPTAIAAGDFNDDGRADLAVVTGSSRALQILLGNGDGTFSSDNAAGLPTPISGLAIGDFNGDGELDLVAVVGDDSGEGKAAILLGNGDGDFAAGSSYPVYPSYPYTPVVGDFNGDGKSDVAMKDDVQKLTLLFGHGDGTLVASSLTLPFSASGLVGGDFNGDGRTDLAAFGSYLVVYLGKEDALLAPLSELLAHSTGGTAYAGDFDGDGVLDVVVNVGGEQPPVLLLGKGDGTFKGLPTLQTSTSSIAAELYASADFNGDGLPDLAAGGDSDGGKFRRTALLNQSMRTANVTISGEAPLGSGAHQIVAKYYGDNTYGDSVSKPVPLNPLSSPAPVVTLSRTLLQFSDTQPVGAPSASQSVTLTNTGTASLALEGFTMTPTAGNGVNFAMSNNCSTNLAANKSCVIRFRFVPYSAGAKVSTLVIADNAGNSPQSITLTGTAAGAPTAALSTTELTFTQPVNTTSPTQTVTLSNTGTSALGISKIALGDDRACEYVTANTCGKALAAQASCLIRVHFNPHSTGGFSNAYLSFDDFSGTPFAAVILRGTATRTE